MTFPTPDTRKAASAKASMVTSASPGYAAVAEQRRFVSDASHELNNHVAATRIFGRFVRLEEGGAASREVRV